MYCSMCMYVPPTYATPICATSKYSEYSLIRHNLFSKNMVDKRVWQINWIFIGTCTLYTGTGELWVIIKVLADKMMVD